MQKKKTFMESIYIKLIKYEKKPKKTPDPWLCVENRKFALRRSTYNDLHCLLFLR